MEKFIQITSFPEVDNLDYPTLMDSLGEIVSNSKLPQISRNDARKLIAVLRNLRQALPELPVINVLLAISSFSIGTQVARKIIFYSSRGSYFEPIKMLARRKALDILPVTENISVSSSCFSPVIQRIAKRKGIKLPEL